MLSELGRPSGRLLRRRLCVGVTLLAYVAAAIGFPAPATSGPASPNACGQAVCCCGSAEQCKASGCGCPHSPAQPPPVESPASCCSKKVEEPTCCTQDIDETVEPSCCSKPASTGPLTNSARQSDLSFRWVVGISALKCQGAADTWVSAGAALPLHAPYQWQPSWSFVHPVPFTHFSASILATTPFDPPPRAETV